MQLGTPAQPFLQDPATLMLYSPSDSSPHLAAQLGKYLKECLAAFNMWLLTPHGASATPGVAEALLYAWLAQDNFLPSVGQLHLLRESFRQISTFLATLQLLGGAECRAIIVALHANKPYGRGNFGDSRSSMTTHIVQACMSAFVPDGVHMLVMEAMPLQQFPLSCGAHQGSKPPFRHPRKYPPLADHIGKLLVEIQLRLVQNSMLRLGYQPAQCIKAVVSCGAPAAGRFHAAAGLEGHGNLKAELAGILLSDGPTHSVPCFKTFHPAALAYQGFGALADTALAFKQAGLVVQGLEPAQALRPKFAELQLAVNRHSGSHPVREVLEGSLGFASIYNSFHQPRLPAYIRLSTAFVTHNLDCSRLPCRAVIAVDKASCPSFTFIQAKLHTSKSSGPNREYKPQKQVRILGLQQVLPLLSLSSGRALVKVQDDQTLHLHFRSSFDLDDSQMAQDFLQSILDKAHHTKQVSTVTEP